MYLLFPLQMYNKNTLLERTPKGVLGLKSLWDSHLCSHNVNSNMKGAAQNRVEVDQSTLSRVKLTSSAARISITIEALKDGSLSLTVQYSRILESKDFDSILVW